jgi:hypothetical protein
VGYLQRQADENPTAFLGLLGRVLPHTLAADPDDGGGVQVFIQWFTGDTVGEPYDPKDWKSGTM